MTNKPNIEIRWGLGTIVRTRQPIKVWFVLKDGRKYATLDSQEAAIKYADRVFPGWQRRHD